MDSCWFLLLGRVLVVEFLAELDELALESFEAVGDGVGHVGVVHRRLGDALPPLRLDDPGPHADHRGVRRARRQHPRGGPQLYASADLDSAANPRPLPPPHLTAPHLAAPVTVPYPSSQR